MKRCQSCGADVSTANVQMVEPLLASVGSARAAWLEQTYGEPISLLCPGCFGPAVAGMNEAVK